MRDLSVNFLSDCYSLSSQSILFQGSELCRGGIFREYFSLATFWFLKKRCVYVCKTQINLCLLVNSKLCSSCSKCWHFLFSLLLLSLPLPSPSAILENCSLIKTHLKWYLSFIGTFPLYLEEAVVLFYIPLNLVHVLAVIILSNIY